MEVYHRRLTRSGVPLRLGNLGLKAKFKVLWRNEFNRLPKNFKNCQMLNEQLDLIEKEGLVAGNLPIEKMKAHKYDEEMTIVVYEKIIKKICALIKSETFGSVDVDDFQFLIGYFDYYLNAKK